MLVVKGEGRWPSLFFAGLGTVALLAAALLQGNAYRSIGVACLALAVMPRIALVPWRAPTGVLLAAFCLWLFAVASVGTPSYSADALYRPAVLFLGFAFCSTRTPEERRRLLAWSGGFVAVLVLLGMAQFYFGVLRLSVNAQRAAATFITPNSFATAINFILLPLFALSLTGRGGRWALAGVVWLFVGLQATESRGGWVACAAGLLAIAAMLGPSGLRAHAADIGRTLLAAAAGAGLFWASTRVPLGEPDGVGAAMAQFGETVFSRGSSMRMDIYNVALSLIAEKPLIGHGADMFRFLNEMRKPAAMDIGHTFYFVHNDYLEVWVEFGLIGLLLLLALIAACAAACWRGAREARILAAGAALAAVFTHAMVDFPLYVPVLLLGVGFWVGALTEPGSEEAASTARFPLVQATLLLAATVWLAQPAAADAAGRMALDSLFAGRVERAIYWQSVARRLEPRNAAHYWSEAVIWRDQAIEAKDRALAGKADMLFADGMREDPYQVANYLERARFRRMHPELFGQASESEILEWTGEAARLRPYSPVALAERARALEHFGRGPEARRIVAGMLQRHPADEMSQRLAAELGVPGGRLAQ